MQLLLVLFQGLHSRVVEYFHWRSYEATKSEGAFCRSFIPTRWASLTFSQGLRGIGPFTLGKTCLLRAFESDFHHRCAHLQALAATPAEPTECLCCPGGDWLDVVLLIRCQVQTHRRGKNYRSMMAFIHAMWQLAEISQVF